MGNVVIIETLGFMNLSVCSCGKRVNWLILEVPRVNTEL